MRASLLHTGARLFLLLVLLVATATAALLLLLPLAILQHPLVDPPEGGTAAGGDGHRRRW